MYKFVTKITEQVKSTLRKNEKSKRNSPLRNNSKSCARFRNCIIIMRNLKKTEEKRLRKNSKKGGTIFLTVKNFFWVFVAYSM
mgnify:CR=1 FL=1